MYVYLYKLRMRIIIRIQSGLADVILRNHSCELTIAIVWERAQFVYRSYYA